MNAEITTALNDLRSTWKEYASGGKCIFVRNPWVILTFHSSAEVAVKLAGDVWVAVRRFGADCEKELYVIVARKDASLADVEGRIDGGVP